MCGIAGYSRPFGRSSIPDGRAFAIELAKALESRGRDATGMGWFDNGWPWFWKCGETSSRCAHQADLPSKRTNTVIVHTRAGTTGSPRIDANNHPVVAPGIVLTHNGILSNDATIYDLIGAKPTDGIVDSLAAAYLLSYGAAAGCGTQPWDLLELVEGDAALAWLNADDDETLHLARLRGRPLVYTTTARGDFIYGSTEQAIKAAAKVAEVVLPHKFVTVPEGVYMKVRRGRVVESHTIKLPPERWDDRWWENYREGWVNHEMTGGTTVRSRTLEPVGIQESIQETLPYGPANVHELFPSKARRKRWSTKDQRWIEVDG